MPAPDRILARRAAQRRRRRRRRAQATAASLALVAVGIVMFLRLGAPGPDRGVPRAAAAPAGVSPHGRATYRGHRPAGLDAVGNAHIRALARLGKPIFCAGRHGRALAFTFDDGPGVYTHLALRKLARAHERATFFVVGRSMNFFPRYLPRELKVGSVADHTYTHPFLPALSRSQITSELQRTRVQIQQQSGQPVNLFRPPYGAINATVLSVAQQLGLLPVLWTQDSRDSLGADYAQIIRNVEAAMRPGAIILMHENRGQTIRALTTLLPVLRRRHLRSVSLPELFATDPPSIAQVREGGAACGAGRISAGSG